MQFAYVQKISGIKYHVCFLAFQNFLETDSDQMYYVLFKIVNLFLVNKNSNIIYIIPSVGTLHKFEHHRFLDKFIS